MSQARVRPFQVISALRHRNYRIYWCGFLVSIMFWQAQAVAQAYLVYQETGSELSLGIVSGSQAIAATIFSLMGGVIADRVERRRLLMITQVGGFACSFSLATLVAFDAVEVWQIALIAFVFGCFQAFDQPTRSALVPQLIDRKDLMNAVALTSIVWQSSAVVGPSIAGVIISVAGTAACFYLASAGFLSFCFALILVRPKPQEEETARKSLVADFGAGIDYIRHNPLFRSLIGVAFFNAFFGLSFVVLLPAVAREELHVGAGGLSLLFSAFGLGSLAGTILVAGLGDFQRKGLLIIGGGALFGALLILFSLSTALLLSIALLIVLGLLRSLYMTSAQTLLQLHLEDRFRGRVTAVYGLQWSLMPLGGVWAGIVADLWGSPAAMAFGGTAVVLFTLLVGLRQPTLRQPLQPALAVAEA